MTSWRVLRTPRDQDRCTTGRSYLLHLRLRFCFEFTSRQTASVRVSSNCNAVPTITRHVISKICINLDCPLLPSHFSLHSDRSYIPEATRNTHLRSSNSRPVELHLFCLDLPMLLDLASSQLLAPLAKNVIHSHVLPSSVRIQLLWMLPLFAQYL